MENATQEAIERMLAKVVDTKINDAVAEAMGMKPEEFREFTAHVRRLNDRTERLVGMPAGVARPLACVDTRYVAGLVLEPARGRTLSDRLRSGPIAVDEVARILDGVLAGLSALHAAGISHRDIRR